MSDPRTMAGDRGKGAALLIGVIALLLCILGGLSHGTQFWRAYLMGYLFWVGITLGCFAMLMLYHMVGGRWGFAVRRPLEAGARLLPLMLLLFIPIIFGMGELYPWMHASGLPGHLAEKRNYLNQSGFIIRTAVCFAIWIFWAWLLNKWSVEQDRTGDPGRTLAEKMRKFSAPGIVLYSVTTYLVSVDWVMSLLPRWYSTIFGMLFMVVQVLTAMAFMAFVMLRVKDRPEIVKAQAAGPNVFRDIGTLIFACEMLWAYMTFSQLIITWSGNLPDEIVWYMPRLRSQWELISMFILVIFFAIPFLLLLSKPIKRNPRFLAMVAGIILVMRVLDLIWLIEPIYHPHQIYIHWMDILAPIGIGGIWIAAYIWQLNTRPILALHDVRVEGVERVAQHG